MEPIICNLGAVVPEDEFIRGVRKLCTRYGTLFIADEVATGFGRTGRLFACEHFDLEPDVLCVDRKSTRLNSSHTVISSAVFCLKKKKKQKKATLDNLAVH